MTAKEGPLFLSSPRARPSFSPLCVSIPLPFPSNSFLIFFLLSLALSPRAKRERVFHVAFREGRKGRKVFPLLPLFSLCADHHSAIGSIRKNDEEKRELEKRRREKNFLSGGSRFSSPREKMSPWAFLHIRAWMGIHEKALSISFSESSLPHLSPLCTFNQAKDFAVVVGVNPTYAVEAVVILTGRANLVVVFFLFPENLASVYLLPGLKYGGNKRGGRRRRIVPGHTKSVCLVSPLFPSSPPSSFPLCLSRWLWKGRERREGRDMG